MAARDVTDTCAGSPSSNTSRWPPGLTTARSVVGVDRVRGRGLAVVQLAEHHRRGRVAVEVADQHLLADLGDEDGAVSSPASSVASRAQTPRRRRPAKAADLHPQRALGVLEGVDDAEGELGGAPVARAGDGVSRAGGPPGTRCGSPRSRAGAGRLSGSEGPRAGRRRRPAPPRRRTGGLGSRASRRDRARGQRRVELATHRARVGGVARSVRVGRVALGAERPPGVAHGLGVVGSAAVSMPAAVAGCSDSAVSRSAVTSRRRRRRRWPR